MAVCLVLGASGQIGRYLVPCLLDAGHDVHASSRTAHPSRHERMHWVRADLFAAPPDLPPLDVIFSLGPLDGFAHWLDQGRFEGTPHLLAFGSMSAVSKRDSADAGERALSARLLESERRVIDTARARGLPWTLFRPTMIYGAGIDRSLSVLARWGCTLRVFPSVPGALGLRQPVHAQDLADVCMLAWKNTRATDTTFELGGGERLTFARMLERVRNALPVRSLALPIAMTAIDAATRITQHVAFLRALRPAVARRLREDLVADTTIALDRLNWRPRGFAPDVATWVPTPLP
ncbi:MAG: NAD-dependent epimerase/dehydratase family protein [Dokdonella sp.]